MLWKIDNSFRLCSSLQWTSSSLNAVLEKKIKSTVEPILKKGRGGDWEHTLRTLEYARHLLEHEEGEEKIVIPTLYLHDIGWSKVDFTDFVNAPPAEKRGATSVSLHMKYGAELAERILYELDFEPERRTKIASIIAIHDEPEKVFAMGDPSATLVVEADYLDRYGPESYLRFSHMFGSTFLDGDHRREAIEYLRQGLDIWFKTQTARYLAEKLAGERGLFCREGEMSRLLDIERS